MADDSVPHRSGRSANREPVPTGSRFLHRVPAAPAIAVIVAVVGIALYQTLPVGVVQDDGLYVILARALAGGHGYRFLNLPGAPAGVHYPPGYPAFLALLSFVLPNITGTVLPYAVVNLVLLGIAAGALYLLARQLGVGPRGAAVAALAGFLMPPALALGTALFSEPLWLATAIPWLLAADRLTRDEAPTGLRAALVLGLAAGAIALVRTQAVSLAFALVVVLAMRRRRRPALAAAFGALLLLVPWQLWVTAHAGEIPAALAGKYGAYGPWFLDGLRTDGLGLIAGALRRNLASAGFLIGGMFAVPRVPSTLSWLLLVPAVAAARRVWRLAPVLFVALVVHAAIILVWPFEPQRFVWGSWPFIALWLVAGAVELDQSWRAYVSKRGDLSPALARGVRVGLRCVGGWFAAGAALTTALLMVTGAFRNIARGGAARLEPTVEWVEKNTPPHAVIASDDETAVYLYTGRPAVPTSSYTAADYLADNIPSAPPTVLDRVVARYRPQFVITYWKRSAQAAERLTTGPSPVLVPVTKMPGGSVFEFADSARDR